MCVHVESNLAWRALANVFHHVFNLLHEIGFLELRCAADLTKSIGYEAKSVDILSQFVHHLVIAMLFSEHLHPTFEGRNGSAQLMSSLLGHACPDLILRGSVTASQCC